MLYQVVWVRLAFASFGIIAPVISVVISVFMLGLAIGSWLGGLAIGTLTRRSGLPAIYFYAACELLIGFGAFLVPPLFGVGESVLAGLGEANSIGYLALSAVVIAVSIFPWCVGMGATFPVMMAFVREQGAGEKSFSHLYLANVLGASLGALLTAYVLIEALGFRHTLLIAGSINVAIAIVAVILGAQSRREPRHAAESASPAAVRVGRPVAWIRSILFTTGFTSLALEVVWTRAFTPVLGTQVYAFALLLVTYLVGTSIGSLAYRRDLAASRLRPVASLLLVVAGASLLPVVLNDPRLMPASAQAGAVLASILPLCIALGYLTPRLIDDHAAGHERLAGQAYALNVLGCILGPLLASYVLLPLLGAALSQVLLALPSLAFVWLFRGEIPTASRLPLAAGYAVLLTCSVFVARSYENPCPWSGQSCEVRRDYAATVVSLGENMDRRMLVNGVGITHLTPITKYMAHLPLTFHAGPPQSALVICFGMGTTYRSLLSWNVRSTAVELVPSVRDAFSYYHEDAARVLRNPNGRIVIDDGRRFLNRTRETYDVIVVDPPPPVETAGSSLLYSREFHEAVKRHLNPGGIFQTWFPGGEENVARGIARSLADVFPYIRIYASLEGWGFHFLASMEPFVAPSPEEMLNRLPQAARADLAEWSHDGLRADISRVLAQEVALQRVLPQRPSIVITDDRPYNEYFLLRRTLGGS